MVTARTKAKEFRVDISADIKDDSERRTGTELRVASVIDRAINNQKVDVKKMREIFDLQMEWTKWQAEIAYNNSMRDAQALIPHIEPNQRNTHTKSTYADLDAIDLVIKPIYTKFGFSLSFDTKTLEDKSIEIVCWVRHIDGHKERHTLIGELDNGGFKGAPNKTGIQAAGSSVSYLQRYLTKLIFNVVIKGEDKDGNRNKNAAPAADEFTQAMNQESAPANNKKPKPTQKPKQSQQEVLPPDNSASVEEGDYFKGQIFINAKKDFLTCVSVKEGVTELEKALNETYGREDRVEIINLNLPLIRTLVKNNHGTIVSALHAIADKGQ